LQGRQRARLQGLLFPYTTLSFFAVLIEQVSEAVTILIYIWEVPGSNVPRNIDFPD
jgi:hypothetical protein